MTIGKVAIGDVVEVNPRLTADSRPELDELVSFVPMASVSEETLAIEVPVDRSYSEVAKGFTPFQRGDILIAKITPCFENGKMAYAEWLPREVGFGSTEFHVLRPGDELHGGYLFHLLRDPSVRRSGEMKMRGAAGQKRVPAEFFKKLRIPLPPLAEQKRIAGILDAADALRAKRRESLAQLDALLQSTFLDMFGDPMSNPMGFPARILSDFYVSEREGTRCGPFGSALRKDELVDSGVPVWNMDNIDPSGRMALPFRMWITDDKYRQLEAYAVRDGDVIISRAGTVGKMCVANSGSARGIISTNLIRVRFGADLLPIYFVSLMIYCKGRVGRLKTGADGALTHMNTGILDNLTFPYPTLDLQRRFAAIVESVEQQKARLRAHLAELDALFASLQSRAFNGAL